MSNKLNITKENVYAYEIDVRCSDETKAIVVQCYDGSDKAFYDLDFNIANSNALLCADALNTYNQTPVLPSELLRQLDEAIKALKQINQMSDPGDYLTAILDCKKIASETLKQIENEYPN